jgi:hypothetical protein
MMEGASTMADQATETVMATFGEASVGYLELAGAKRQEHLNSRLSAFASQTDLPPWQAMTHHVRELGGIYANELLLSAPIEMDTDPRPWTNLLASRSSIAVDPEGLSMSFFTQRSFDPDASRILGAPTVAYSEGIIAVAHNSDPRPDTSVMVIDREGPREVLAVQAAPEPKLPIELPDRRKRFSAYADHLVGWQDKESCICR